MVDAIAYAELNATIAIGKKPAENWRSIETIPKTDDQILVLIEDPEKEAYCTIVSWDESADAWRTPEGYLYDSDIIIKHGVAWARLRF